MDLIKKPSAWMPIAISLFLSISIYVGIFTHSILRQTDEGAGAHIFQLLMCLQTIVIIFFIIKYLIKFPKQTAIIFLIQVLAIILAFSPVYLFRL